MVTRTARAVITTEGALPMARRIEDYAVIGNCETMALVHRDASIEWLCLPRFDSDACFAALLGDGGNGYWRLAPTDGEARIARRYRDGTLVLETEFTTDTGCVVVIDCMRARDDDGVDVLRLVRGVRGSVPMCLRLCLRFGYGRVVPWVTRTDDGRLQAVAGPDRLILATPVELRGEELTTLADFTVEVGDEVPFALSWKPSWRPLADDSPDVVAGIAAETAQWQAWSSRYRGDGEWSDAVKRSLITLKALTHRDTGGIVAAATTSLPEEIGGERNWDYRYCWLRDSTFTLYALTESGYEEEATAWRKWLLRAVAGDPTRLHIMYGIGGERRLSEFELPWLSGYEGSCPVRVGNAASGQLQLDVYGELMDSLYHGRHVGLDGLDAAWNLQRMLVTHLESIWREPDEGIWEIRGPRQHFTHSKVMVWVALDRAVRSIEEFGVDGPLEHWRDLRQRIHDDVCTHGFDAKLGSFVQSYGSRQLDAALLQIPLVGFLRADDARVRGTIAAIEQRLLVDGFVRRYDTGSDVDGLGGSEGVFLACSFWLADCMVLQGRHDEARALFERLLTLRNDVGLLAEEYDPHACRQLGNFPQAFSHIALVNTAHNLSRAAKPAEKRAGHGKQG
jgi:GH15 family glucan-1,4-alpha-glucosidase